MPKISVVMATYNDEKFIYEAVESILNQTHKDFEFIIVNDGSTDSTGEILEKFQDKRMKVINQDNMGLAKSKSKAIKLSKGEYIAILDGDDISLPERLEQQKGYLDRNKDVGLVGVGKMEIDETGGDLYPIYYPENNNIIQERLIQENCFCNASMMFRKHLCEEIGGFRSEFKTSEGYDFLLRFAEISKLHNLHKISYKRRLNTKGITSMKLDQMRAYHQLACTLAKRRRLGENENLEMNIEKIVGKIDKDISKNDFISKLLRKRRYLVRVATTYYGIGCIHLYKGDLRRARGLFLHSLKHNLFNIKAYICSFLTLLPFSLIKHSKFLFKGTAQYYKDLNGDCK